MVSVSYGFKNNIPDESGRFVRDRASLVAFARESIARGSKSFRFASRLFDRTTRERVWLLYAWCRKCDDMADGQDHGGAMAVVDDPLERLAIIRDLTAKALAGEATGEPADTERRADSQAPAEPVNPRGKKPNPEAP